MKSLFVFLVIFLLLVSIGCMKEPGRPLANAVVPVIPISKKDTSNPVRFTFSPGRIIAENLTWDNSWYTTVEIKEFSNMVSSTALMKVFIQRASDIEWKEVPLISNNSDSTIKYEYYVESRADGGGMFNLGSLYIFYYGTDVSDHPSLKIEY